MQMCVCLHFLVVYEGEPLGRTRTTLISTREHREPLLPPSLSLSLRPSFALTFIKCVVLISNQPPLPSGLSLACTNHYTYTPKHAGKTSAGILSHI
jgi:hypothetical protein